MDRLELVGEFKLICFSLLSFGDVTNMFPGISIYFKIFCFGYPKDPQTPVSNTVERKGVPSVDCNLVDLFRKESLGLSIQVMTIWEASLLALFVIQ